MYFLLNKCHILCNWFLGKKLLTETSKTEKNIIHFNMRKARLTLS